MKKLKILTKSVGYDGFERSILLLANSLCDVFDIEIICLNKKYDTLPVDLNKKIKLTYINNNNFIDNIFAGLKLKNYMKNNFGDVILYTDISFNKYIAKLDYKRVLWDTLINKNEEYKPNFIKYKDIYNTIVVPSFFMKDYYKRMFNEENLDIKVVVIPNAFYEKIDVKAELNKKNIIVVGKLKKDKRLVPFLDVFKDIIKEDDEIKLTIIGDGEERLNITKTIRENDLSNNVTLLGYIEHERLVDELKSGSLFVMPSKDITFGLVLLEALNIGLPSIVYEDTLKMTDCIKNELNGFIVKDDLELKDRILEIMNNNDLRKNMGDCAKEMSNSFSIESLKIEWIKYL